MKSQKYKYHFPIQMIYLLVLIDSYFLSTFHLFNSFQHDPSSFEFPDALGFFSYFNHQFLIGAMLALNLMIPLMSLVNINSRTFRILNFLLFFATKGLVFTFYQYAHYYWPLLWTLLILCVPKDWSGEEETEEIHLQTYRCAVFVSLSIYFYAGFWKLVDVVGSVKFLDLEYPSQVIAFYLLSRGKLSLLGDIAVGYSFLTYLLFFLFVAMQLLSPLVLFSKKFLKVYLVFIVCFHTANILVLQVNYFFAGFVALILLYYAPDGVVMSSRSFSWLKGKAQ